MPYSIQQAMREPLRPLAVLWPLAMLTPYLPGLPRPANGGLPWRQEIVIALLISLTLALFIKRPRSINTRSFKIPRSELLLLLLPMMLFVLWNAASILWSTFPYKTIYMALEWSTYLIFFVLVRGIVARPKILRASVFVLGAVICVLGLACMVWFIGAPSDTPVAQGSLFNFFSGFSEMMSVVAPFFAALALSVRKPKIALGCGATALLAWLAMLQAMERAPVIGAAIGFGLLAAGSLTLRNCRPRNFTRAAILIAAFVAATALQLTTALYHQAAPGTQGKGSALTRLQSTAAADANLHVRFLYWGIALEMLRAHPLLGVGGYTYEDNFSDARARFAAAHVDNPVIGMNEELRIQQPHSEYVQVLAELGIVGFILFVMFCLGLVAMFWRALRRSPKALPALGAGGGLFAFALASGTSVNSFQWLAGGLVFFFAVAIICQTASHGVREDTGQAIITPALLRVAASVAFVFSLVILYAGGIRAMNAIMQATAATGSTSERVEQRYRTALFWDSRDAGTHFAYGTWLYGQGRAGDAAAHLRYAVAHGFNTSDCFAALAAAEAEAGDLPGAEATLQYAVNVYPRSVFLRVRHASALLEIRRQQEAGGEYAKALSLDESGARGWWQLIRNGSDAAKIAADADPRITVPDALFPRAAIFVVIAESKRRPLPRPPSEQELLAAASSRLGNTQAPL
ncbi:MAG: O-antigen ligase family protein [Pyrinomonadaceae bacterium]